MKPDNDATSSVLYPAKAEGHPASWDGYLFSSDQERTEKGSYLIGLGKRGTELGSYLTQKGKRQTKKGSYLMRIGSYLFPSEEEETKKGKPQLALGRLGKEKGRFWNLVPKVSDENRKTGNAIPGASDENRKTGNESSETGNEKGKTGILASGLAISVAGFPILLAECRVARRSILAAIGVLQFEEEAHMKNPVWDDTVPHSDEEIKAEIRRMASELEEMLERSRQSDARAQRNIQETNRILERLQEKLNVA